MKNTIFVMAFLAATTCTAATKITYDEIPKHLGRFGTILVHRGFTVVTNDGIKHKARSMVVTADHVKLFREDFSSESLPSNRVTRIEVGQFGRFFHHIVWNAQGSVPFSADPVVVIVMLPFLAYTAASAPFFLVADGIALLIPPKVYEIVH